MPNEPARVTDPQSPVREVGSGGQQFQPGVALCLSGGGYRAMVFHVGVLWRLNEIGSLPKLDRISSGV
jgi:NTE family protein